MTLVVLLLLAMARAQQRVLAPHLNPIFCFSSRCMSATATTTTMSRVSRVRGKHVIESRLHRTARSVDAVPTPVSSRRRRRRRVSIPLFAERGGVESVSHGSGRCGGGCAALLGYGGGLAAEGFRVLGQLQLPPKLLGPAGTPTAMHTTALVESVHFAKDALLCVDQDALGIHILGLLRQFQLHT